MTSTQKFSPALDRDTRRSLLRDTRGLSSVEYIILLVLVAVGGISVWNEFSETVKGRIESSDTAIQTM